MQNTSIRCGGGFDLRRIQIFRGIRWRHCLDLARIWYSSSIFQRWTVFLASIFRRLLLRRHRFSSAPTASIVCKLEVWGFPVTEHSPYLDVFSAPAGSERILTVVLLIFFILYMLLHMVLEPVAQPVGCIAIV